MVYIAWGWMIYMIVAGLTALLLVPLKYWLKLLPAGVAALLIVLAIDNTLTSLMAFQFVHEGLYFFKLPLTYWISYFFGGILFAYFRPEGKWKRILYIFGAALFLLTLEYIMMMLGYFQHLNWNLLNSYVLNIFGFVISLWIIEWFELYHKTYD